MTAWTEDEYQRYLSKFVRRAVDGESPSTPAQETERAFQSDVVRLARLYGYLCYHTFDSRRSGIGFPDLAMTDGKRILYVELKSATGKVSAPQKLWLSMLAHAGAEVYLWRPADLESIPEILLGKKKGTYYAGVRRRVL
jgi:hypothetical protein